jgi:hypothetical protein
LRQVGAKPTVKEQIEITKRRSKLLNRIADHQRRANRILSTDCILEANYGYEPSERFEVGNDGEIELLMADSVSDPFVNSDKSPRPETYQLTMPSSMERTTESNFLEAARLEVRLRAGQCNDSLQGVRLALGKKAFLFRAQIRPKGPKTGKTKSWDGIHAADQSLRLHAQTYRSAREAMVALRGSAELLARYQVLKTEHLKTSTTLLDPAISGWKHAELPWFWYLDVAGDSISSDHMKECKLQVIILKVCHAY